MEFKIVSERPVDSDGLNAGVHKAVANRLVTIIKGEENNSCTIGIEAGWGCGKSSVVEMMSEELAKHDIVTYIFDSWEHEGETLRRGFLRGFIKHICAGKKLDNKDAVKALNDKCDELKINTKIHTDKKCIAITIAGVFTPLVLGLSTIGALLIEKGLDKGSYRMAFNAPICPELLIGTVLVLLPAVCALLAWIFKWNFLSLDASSQESGGSEYRFERSSLDFQEEFEEIVDLTRKLGYKKIVIVIDNLDRVQREDAMRLWSTLKIFLSKKLVPYLWVIIPYDFDGLTSLWRQERANTEAKDPSDFLFHDKTSLAQSFLEKSVPLRVELPYVRIDALTSYLDCILQQAFPRDAESKKEIIRNVFIFTRRGLDDIPSPRQVKNYVNQVGILRELYENVAGLETVCYYAILRYYRQMTKADIHEAIVHNKISSEDIRMVAWVPDFLERIAAIHYGVDIVSARSVTLISPLANALKQEGIEPLQNLMTRYGDDFWVQINLILEKELKNGWTQLVSNAFAKLHAISKSAGVKSSLFALLQAHEEDVLSVISNLSSKVIISLLDVAQVESELMNRIVSGFVNAFRNTLVSASHESGMTLKSYLDVASSGLVDKHAFVLDNSIGHAAWIRLCELSLQESVNIDSGLISVDENYAKECVSYACRVISEKNVKGVLPYLFDVLMGREASWYKGAERCIMPYLESGGALMTDYLRTTLKCCMAGNLTAFKPTVESPKFWQNVCALANDDSRSVAYLVALHQTRNRSRIIELLRIMQQRYGINTSSVAKYFDLIEQKDPSLAISLMLDQARLLNSFEFVSWVLMNDMRVFTSNLAKEVVDQGLIGSTISVSPVNATVALYNMTSDAARCKILDAIIRNEELLQAFVFDASFAFSGSLLPIIAEMIPMSGSHILTGKVKELIGKVSEDQWKRMFSDKSNEFYALKAFYGSCGSLEVLGNPYIAAVPALFSSKRSDVSCYGESEQLVIRNVLTKMYRKMFDESVVEIVFKADFNIPQDTRRLALEAFSSSYKDEDRAQVLSAALKRAHDRNDIKAEQLISEITSSVAESIS